MYLASNTVRRTFLVKIAHQRPMYLFPVTSTIISANVCLLGCCPSYKKGCMSLGGTSRVGAWLSESSDHLRAGSTQDRHTCTELVPPGPPAGKPEREILLSHKPSKILQLFGNQSIEWAFQHERPTRAGPITLCEWSAHKVINETCTGGHISTPPFHRHLLDGFLWGHIGNATPPGSHTHTTTAACTANTALSKGRKSVSQASHDS